MDVLDWRDAQTPAQRLGWAIAHQRPEGKRRGRGLFCQKLGEAGYEKGANYPTLRGYLDGSTEMSVDYLLAAAKVLEINAGWLVLGQGAPNRTAEQAARLNPLHADEQHHWLGNEVRNRLHQKIGLPPVEVSVWGDQNGEHVTFWRIPAWVPAIGDLWTRLRNNEPIGAVDAHGRTDPASLDPAIDELVDTLAAPILALNIDANALPLGDYVLALLPALTVLADARTRALQAEATKG